MNENKNLLQAIRELIVTPEGTGEWNQVVGKFPELLTPATIETMEKILEAFDEDTMPEIILHWRARVDFLKKMQAPPDS